MNRISVIVTNFNKEDYLERCLLSLLNQTYQQFEVIIIDDGSTDGSGEILNAFERMHEHIHVYLYEENKGAAWARNTGIEKAKGEFIYFLDADDYVAPHTLELMVKHIGQAPLLVGMISPTPIDQEVRYEEELPASVSFLKEKIRTKVFRRKSIVNILMRKDHVERLGLSFHEELMVYSDLTFFIPAIQNVEHIPYLQVPTYFRGECYDPIDRPSLRYLTNDVKIPDYLSMFIYLMNEFREDSFINSYLSVDFINYYYKTMSTYLTNNPEFWDVWFDSLVECVNLLDKDSIENCGFLTKREMKAIRSGLKRTVMKRIAQRQTYHRLRQALKGRQALYKELYRSVFKKRPIKSNRIVFESFSGKGYSDNPRAIYEELLAQGQPYEFVWILNDVQKEIPGNAKKVRRLSWKYYYYLATSKYWVINARMPNYITKRPETVFLQTWHGTPLKKLAADMKEVRMPGTTTERYKRNFYLDSQKWDYLVSPNDYSTDIFKRAFKFKKEVLDVGYPRNDVLYQKNNPSEISSLKEKMGLPKDKKIILYAPTWRDDEFHKKGQYKFDLKLDLKGMREQLGDDYVLVLRMHYLIADSLNIDGYEGFVYNLSSYDDIAEMYLVSDILITDYSSVFFDFANLKRPILFFTYDLEKYRDTLRGFYFNFTEVAPGPILLEAEEITKAIVSIDHTSQQFEDRFEAFFEEFCHLDDGTASKRIIEEVFRNESIK
ncbi:CDP-glycerol glycerophosphotransferase family protein [Alkalihalophilus sp. As8PL]|uniref:CDP-glycerol glycerophosphotransferase family protein n=1 Tax=Alkalihalophilus sp. As8PL TaxID=3237103 RepID=A0AB39BQJ6_9BACI